MENIDLTPNGDGTYTARKYKRADGSEYTPAQYNNVGKLCNCKGTAKRQCMSPVDEIGHIHICSKCGGVMSECKMPW